MSRNSARERGYTVAELLSVIFVMALIMSAVALIIGPLMRSQSQTQAKVDTVQAADMALYRMERDLRNANSAQVWACTTGATPNCQPPTTAVTTTSAIVLTSAYLNGAEPFQLLATGKPNWQGATVYWVDAAGNLDVAFDKPATFIKGNAMSNLQAAQAVTDVQAAGGMQLARFVETLAIAESAGSPEVTLQMQAQSTVNGALNETTYLTEVHARN